jgi:hypothetical protein
MIAKLYVSPDLVPHTSMYFFLANSGALHNRPESELRSNEKEKEILVVA